MSEYPIDDIRIKNIKELLPPIAVLEKYPNSKESAQTVFNSRQSIFKILNNQDDRLLVIIGPCSIHDPVSAIEYAQKLNELRDKHSGTLEVVMRVYFEKPRTTVGWKGLINDPYLDDSFKLNDGLRIGRKLLLDINNMGLPTAGEFLDMITPQYMADLISWGAIGARTTESQVHRELSSGLSCPVGFKNGTDGNIKIATDAIRAAQSSHHFLSVTKNGHSAIVETTGNPDCHIILRGGKEPNYSSEDVAAVICELQNAGLREKIMIDLSHANCGRNYKRQLDVAQNIATQISSGNQAIFGVMIESHLVEGRQDLLNARAEVYGQSITDACIGWEDTERVLQCLADAVQDRRAPIDSNK